MHKNHRIFDRKKQIDKPCLPKFIPYQIARLGLRLFNLSDDIKYIYHYDPESLRNKQVIVIADHASFDNFAPVIAGWRLNRLNIVGGRFFCSSLSGRFLCKTLGGIPKNLYQNDYSSMRQMLSVISRGGSLLIFIEGIQGISGSSMPINPGTVSFLKGVGLPVILAHSYGLYLLHPLYAQEKRRGYAELHYDLLFTPEELKENDSETIYQKLLSKFRFNDFEWNEQYHHRYKAKKGNATGLEKLLYLCPQCGQEQTMRSECDDLFCTACGNRVHLENDYRLVPASGSFLPYRHIDEWAKSERRRVRKEIEMPSFYIEYDSRVYYVSEHSLNATNPYVAGGEGHIRIDANEISYCGTYKGKMIELSRKIADTPSFFLVPEGYNCFSVDDTWYGFEPLNNEANPYKICFAVEELHNRIDPVWNRVSRDAYDA